MYRNICPNQKTGADTPNRAKPMANRSPRDLGFNADSTPMGMPMEIQTNAAPKASCAVTPSRCMMIGFSGDLVLNDLPSPGQPNSSPRKMCLTNTAYWTMNGLSSPNCFL